MGVAPHVSTVTITTAGTRVQGAGTSSKYVNSVYVEALKTNTGVIYVGDSSVSSTLYMCALSAGAGFTISVDTHNKVGGSTSGPELQLNSLYFDCSVSGEKCQMTYLNRIDNA